MDYGEQSSSIRAGQNEDPGSGSLNISEIIELFVNDPDLGGPSALWDMPRTPTPQAGYTEIIEQPAPKALRFRYECEGRSAGSIPGVNSTPENRSYPTIRICAPKGYYTVVVSCVTKDEKKDNDQDSRSQQQLLNKPRYWPHPHNLVGHNCAQGVCTVRETIGDDGVIQVQFKNLGVQCVKRRDIAEALKTRENLRVDPFRTKFNHKNNAQSIDLNAVRLCFQVFQTDETKKTVIQTLTPVVSDVIYDKKAMSDLQIAQISHCSGSAAGSTKVILLCEKVNREEVAVVFFEEAAGQEVWRARAHIEAVHKQYAIVFHSPPYRRPDLADNVSVKIKLERLTDGASSTTVDWEYIAPRRCLTTDSKYLERMNVKRKRLPSYAYDPVPHTHRYSSQEGVEQKVKLEPHDRTPPHHTVNPAFVGDQPWQPELSPYGAGQFAGGVAGVSAGPGYGAGYPHMWSSPQYAGYPMQPSPDMMPQAMHAMSPNAQVQQSHLLQPIDRLPDASVSPGLAPSPGMAHSPGAVHSPGMVSPGMAHSPGMVQMQSPLGHVQSPIGHVQSVMPPQQQQQQYVQLGGGGPTLMETTGSISLSGLLEGPNTLLNSGDLSNLSQLAQQLAERPADLSDSLNRLSTSDLLQ